MDIESEKRLLAKYPFHIYLLVMAAQKALKEGKATIQNGMLVFSEEGPPLPKEKS